MRLPGNSLGGVHVFQGCLPGSSRKTWAFWRSASSSARPSARSFVRPFARSSVCPSVRPSAHSVIDTENLGRLGEGTECTHGWLINVRLTAAYANPERTANKITIFEKNTFVNQIILSADQPREKYWLTRRCFLCESRFLQTGSDFELSPESARIP